MKNDIDTLLSKSTEWEDTANSETALCSMIESLYEYKLVKGFSSIIYPAPHTLKSLYNKKRDLLNELVEVVCGTSVITPRDINKDGTNENHLFIIFLAIMDIELYYVLENSERKDGYHKRYTEYKKAHTLLSAYSDRKIPVSFPRHKNEIIRELDYVLRHSKRKNQADKIISLIKSSYNIKALTLTREEKEARRFFYAMKLLRRANNIVQL